MSFSKTLPSLKTAIRPSDLLNNIKSHLMGNDAPLADYPEAIYPIRCLEGEARRCTGQPR